MIYLLLGLILGAIVAVISLLIGFSLGKYQQPFSPQVKKKLDEVMGRVVSKHSDVGAVERPSSRDVELRDNPNLAQEQQIMGRTFEEAINR